MWKDMNYLNCVYKYLMGGSEEGARLFSVVPNEGVTGGGHRLKYRKFHLNMKKI